MTVKTSSLQDFPVDAIPESLRPDLTPPPKPVPAEKKKKPVPLRPVPTKSPPPLRVSFTLIGTVIESDNSHAVLKNRQGVVLVVRPGEQLPSPDDNLKLQTVSRDSATVSNGTQTAVIRPEKK